MAAAKKPSDYLKGVPSLPDRVLAELERRGGPTPETMREADRVLARLRQVIREARTRHERQTGERVIPERPAGDCA